VSEPRSRRWPKPAQNLTVAGQPRGVIHLTLTAREGAQAYEALVKFLIGPT
jgi:hypothetical protein